MLDAQSSWHAEQASLQGLQLQSQVAIVELQQRVQAWSNERSSLQQHIADSTAAKAATSEARLSLGTEGGQSKLASLAQAQWESEKVDLECASKQLVADVRDQHKQWEAEREEMQITLKVMAAAITRAQTRASEEAEESREAMALAQRAWAAQRTTLQEEAAALQSEVKQLQGTIVALEVSSQAELLRSLKVLTAAQHTWEEEKECLQDPRASAAAWEAEKEVLLRASEQRQATLSERINVCEAEVARHQQEAHEVRQSALQAMQRWEELQARTNASADVLAWCQQACKHAQEQGHASQASELAEEDGDEECAWTAKMALYAAQLAHLYADTNATCPSTGACEAFEAGSLTDAIAYHHQREAQSVSAQADLASKLAAAHEAYAGDKAAIWKSSEQEAQLAETETLESTSVEASVQLQWEESEAALRQHIAELTEQVAQLVLEKEALQLQYGLASNANTDSDSKAALRLGTVMAAFEQERGALQKHLEDADAVLARAKHAENEWQRQHLNTLHSNGDGYGDGDGEQHPVRPLCDTTSSWNESSSRFEEARYAGNRLQAEEATHEQAIRIAVPEAHTFRVASEHVTAQSDKDVPSTQLAATVATYVDQHSELGLVSVSLASRVEAHHLAQEWESVLHAAEVQDMTQFLHAANATLEKAQFALKEERASQLTPDRPALP
jgi:hypothetical protein